MRERYRTIARVAKARGRRGEVVTEPVHGLPSLVREGLEVAVLPPDLRGPRWRTVTSVAGDARSGRLVALSGVGDVSSAEALVGKVLLARERDLPEEVPVRRGAANRLTRTHRIRTDTGVEIAFPSELAERPGYLDFSTDAEGRITITVGNVAHIENR